MLRIEPWLPDSHSITLTTTPPTHNVHTFLHLTKTMKCNSFQCEENCIQTYAYIFLVKCIVKERFHWPNEIWMGQMNNNKEFFNNAHKNS